MIKAISGNNIILGIDANNVEQLQQDNPIKILGAQLGIDFDIYIVYGHTLDEALTKILKVKPDTGITQTGNPSKRAH